MVQELVQRQERRKVGLGGASSGLDLPDKLARHCQFMASLVLDEKDTEAMKVGFLEWWKRVVRHLCSKGEVML